MPVQPSRLSHVALAALLAVGAVACSSGSSSEGADAGSSDRTPEPTSEEAATEQGDGEDRPFGVDDGGLAASMKAGTGADRVEVDGSTFRLYFGEGSTEDVTAGIHCRAMDALTGPDESVVLVYPDGEKACSDV